ncbi:hypothetical protein ACSCB1_12715 [Streptomyces europaeiscabiei]|uniref:hypothetical protein n=2 Tax=Streptomyces europaeiscabiei TaxID=146819 RepID=UPI000B1A3F6D|nr:hypothetical protein [Streptomyces europaeiscabiei]MDX2760617.1 hypothetical protein [Streptomyces europaeiscabiei]
MPLRAVAAGAVITPTVMATTGDSGTANAADTGTEGTMAGTTTGTFPRTLSEAATGAAPVEAAFPVGPVGVRRGGTDETTGGGIRLRTPTAARASGGRSATADARWPTAATC